MDRFVLCVLGVLAFVPVNAWAVDNIVKGSGMTQSAAQSACETFHENEDPEDHCTYCNFTACGSSTYNGGSSPVSSIKLQADNSWGVQKAFHWVYGDEAECPDGQEPDEDGLCKEPPDCEHGQIQIGDNAGDCRADCDALGEGESDNYWGEGTTSEADYQDVGPGCDPQTGCAVTPQRFHKLVDDSLVTEWTHTGSACSEGSDPLGVGDAESDGCVGEGFSEFCYEDAAQDGNCGTFNGERVCFDAVPEDGQCTGADGAGSSYTCATQGDYSVIPELPDGLTADEQGAVTMANAEANATVTVSGGSVSEGDPSLDEPEPPTEGEEGAGEHDGSGEGEDEKGLCDKAPHLCEKGEADVSNKDVPETSSDIGNLVGGGEYPNVISGGGGCPQPQTVSLPDSLGGGTLEIPFTAFCDMAEILRPLVLGLAYLTAFYAAVRILA